MKRCRSSSGCPASSDVALTRLHPQSSVEVAARFTTRLLSDRDDRSCPRHDMRWRTRKFCDSCRGYLDLHIARRPTGPWTTTSRAARSRHCGRHRSGNGSSPAVHRHRTSACSPRTDHATRAPRSHIPRYRGWDPPDPSLAGPRRRRSPKPCTASTRPLPARAPMRRAIRAPAEDSAPRFLRIPRASRPEASAGSGVGQRRVTTSPRALRPQPDDSSDRT